MNNEMIQAARAALSRPANLAEGLPGAFYGAEFYELEQRSLFTNTWCAVAVATTLPNPGDVLPIDLAGTPIVLTRTRDGEIHAFHNICRHRGLRLVHQACNSEGLRIRCPWHAWTYDLKGKLLGTPELGGPGVNSVEGFDRGTLGLKPIAVGRWHDYVFVNIDGKAPPFEQHIRPLDELLAQVDLSRLKHGHRLDYAYDGNWKIATESGIEDYHLPFAHPQLNAHLYRNSTPCAVPGVYVGGSVAVAGASDTGEAKPRAWNARLPSLLSPSGAPLSELFVLTLFPTGTVLITADHIMLGTLLPEGPYKTRVELHLYYDGDSASDPQYSQARADNVAMWEEVLPQDFAFIAGAQAAMGARDAAGIATRFSPYWETAVLKFQQMVLDAVV